MIRYKVLLFVLLLASMTFSSCSGLPKTIGGGGTATVLLTLVSDTPPASPSLLSYEVTVTQVTVTPTTGTAFTFTPNPAPVFELLRLQSDSAFVASVLNVPSGTYNSITLSANGKSGLGIDFALSTSISVASGVMTVTFTPATAGVNVLSAFTLPRNANLTANQLDLIENFVGVVSVSGQNVTITSQTRGTLTASTTSNTVFDPDPSGTLCSTPSSACIVANQVASVDAILNSDGTLSIQEFEPLLNAQQDVVEGTVAAINQTSQTQFTIITTDKGQLATGSLIGALNVGDPLTVNIALNPNLFLVDQKGLLVSQNFNGSFINFANQTNTTAIHVGQSVTVHVTSFTAATASASASCNTDTVTLRWSRLTATPISQPGPTFNFTGIPSYFNLPPTSLFEVQTFVGTAGTRGITNLEGITDVTSLNDSKPVALRALYLQNLSNSAAPAFFAAKVRQH